MTESYVAPDPNDPALAARNMRLGLILGAVVLAITGYGFWLFSTEGLPKDPNLFQRLEQRGEAPAGTSSAIPNQP